MANKNVASKKEASATLASPEIPVPTQPVVVAPYILRARQDTTFMKFKDGKIVYSDKYRRGTQVCDPQKVIDILASNQAHHFIKVSVGAN